MPGLFKLRPEIIERCAGLKLPNCLTRFAEVYGPSQMHLAAPLSKTKTFDRLFEGESIKEVHFLEFCPLINLWKGWNLCYGDFCDAGQIERLDKLKRVREAVFDAPAVGPNLIDHEGCRDLRRDFSDIKTVLASHPSAPSTISKSNALPNFSKATSLPSTSLNTRLFVAFVGIGIISIATIFFALSISGFFAQNPDSADAQSTKESGKSKPESDRSQESETKGSVGEVHRENAVIEPKIIVEVIQSEQLVVPLAEARLPLIAGDGVRISITSDEPLFYYLLWFDASGKIAPIWPWKDSNWNEIPSDRAMSLKLLIVPEQPSAQEDTFIPLSADSPGLNAILVLARRMPLESVSDLETLTGFGRAGAQSPLYMDSIIEIDRSGIFRDQQRTPIGDKLINVPKSPLTLLHSLISRRFAEQGDVSHAVCFPVGTVRNE